MQQCECAVECGECGCLFIPGGKKETMMCAGCLEEKVVVLSKDLTAAKANARRIYESAETLLAVSKLEYHDKNFLCNPKSTCIQQMEYLTHVMGLSREIDNNAGCQA